MQGFRGSAARRALPLMEPAKSVKNGLLFSLSGIAGPENECILRSFRFQIG